MSFKLKSIIGFVIIQGAIMLSLILASTHYIAQQKQHDISEQTNINNRVFADIVSLAVQNQDLAQLDHYAHAFLQNPDVLYVRIFDEKQDILSHSKTRKYIVQHSTIKPAASETAYISVKSAIRHQGNVIGHIEVAYSTLGANSQAFSLQNVILYIFLVQLIGTIVLYFYLKNVLVDKTRELKYVAEQITEGNLSVNVNAQGNDVYAILGKALNKLIVLLKHRNKLDDISHRLMTSVQNTRPLMRQDQTINKSFDFALECLLLVTECRFGMILTLDNDDTCRLKGISTTEWNRNESRHFNKNFINTVDYSDIESTICESLKTNKNLVVSRSFTIKSEEKTFELSSCLVVPVSHQGEINGIVVLAHEKDEYDYDYIFDANRPAWMAISNLIYINFNNQRMQSIQKDLSGHISFISAIYECIPESIITTDARGIITHVNKVTCTLFGYSEDELLGQNISILMPEPYRSQHGSLMSGYIKKGKPGTNALFMTRELVALTKNDDIIPIEISISKLENPDNGSYYVGVISDISRQKKNIEEIRFANRQATQSYVDRHNFINTLASIVLEPTKKLTSDIRRQFTERTKHEKLSNQFSLMTQSNILLHNIENIIYYTSLVSADIRFKKDFFCLNTLFQRIKYNLKQEQSTFPIKLTLDIKEIANIYYYHDEQRIEQVFTRIIKHLLIKNPMLDQIKIRIESNESVGRKDRIQLLIEAYRKAGAPTAYADMDSNLDLDVASMMLGYINGNYSSSMNHNLTIHKTADNTIPVRVKLDLTRTDIDPIEMEESCGTVLLLDDDNHTLSITTHLLENIGFTVHTAHNGQEAIDMFMKSRYIALFIDIFMPDMDGHEVTQVIREYEDSKFLCNTPIIATTGEDNKDELRRCLSSGMNDYIRKPFTIEELIIKTGLHIQLSDELDKNPVFNYESVSGNLTDYFLDKVDDYITEIKQCLLNNNWDALKNCIKSLQNMCRVTGNDRITELAIELEFQSALTDPSAIADTLARIKSVQSDIALHNHKLKHSDTDRAAGE